MKKKIIIGIVGLFCAGKDTVADYLISKGFKHYSLADILREICRRKNMYKSRDDLVKAGNQLREKYGSGYLAKLALNKAKKIQFDKLVISSIRNPGEIKELKKDSYFFLMEVKAPLKIRYQRAKKRSKIDDKVSFEKFKNQEKFERKGSKNQQRLNKVIAMADFKILNNKNIKELKKNIDKILKTINRK